MALRRTGGDERYKLFIPFYPYPPMATARTARQTAATAATAAAPAAPAEAAPKKAPARRQPAVPRAAPVKASAARSVPAAKTKVKAKAEAADTRPRKKAPAEKPPKPEKRRVKLVRDGFTMPEADFALIDTLKARALEARHPAKKSELLRAGLQALAQLPAEALAAALQALAPVKLGRPRKGH